MFVALGNQLRGLLLTYQYLTPLDFDIRIA